jgi:hypothetical protein
MLGHSQGRSPGQRRESSDADCGRLGQLLNGAGESPQPTGDRVVALTHKLPQEPVSKRWHVRSPT